MRQIVLDTETTGIDPKKGHRIIEIGCVELMNRRLTGNNYHQYINPQREIEAEAIAIHGITNEFLIDKPVFDSIAESFYQYIHGAELIIHNAAFDVGFINHEFQHLKNSAEMGQVSDYCQVIDTLMLARKKHRGQRNSLDALCRRYDIDNSHRELHGALLDAEILADVYLAMTGGQISLSLDAGQGSGESGDNKEQAADLVQRISQDRSPLTVLLPSEAELSTHREVMGTIAKRSQLEVVWD